MAIFHLFLWLSSIPLCVCVYMYTCVYIYHIFFIQSSIEGFFSCFYVLATVNRAAMNIGVHIVTFLTLVSCHSVRYCFHSGTHAEGTVSIWNIVSLMIKEINECSRIIQWLLNFYLEVVYLASHILLTKGNNMAKPDVRGQGCIIFLQEAALSILNNNRI